MNRSHRSALAALAIIILLPGFSARAQTDGCLTCHQALEDEHATLFLKDIHRERGISCADCHGGDRTADDMEQAMNPDAGFRGVPVGDEITRTCASCHSEGSVMVKRFNSPLPWDQETKLLSSVHSVVAPGGKQRLIQCTTCHNSHGIVSVKNPRSPVHPLNVTKTCGQCHSDAGFMKTYNPSLPVDQLEKYRTSVHGKKNAGGDVKVAQCASCHGSHEIRSAKDVKSMVYPTNIPATCASCHSNPEYMRGYGIASDQFEKYSHSVHGVALLERQDIGAPACNDCHGNHAATPPGVESISNVCGTCHALNAELFAQSPHKKAFDSAGLPECETCHGNHDILAATDSLLGVSEETVCSWCHGGEPESRAYLVASSMRQLADSLAFAEQTAIDIVDDAEQKGMEISDARYKLRNARQAILQSRTMVHSFDDEKYRELVEGGLKVTGEVRVEAQGAIEEYFFRRWGLMIATLLMTVLSVSLYVYIRRIERRQQLHPGSQS